LRTLEAPPGVFAWERASAGDRRRIAVNFSSAPAVWAAGGRVDVATERALEGGDFDGVLPPDAAVILSPR